MAKFSKKTTLDRAEAESLLADFFEVLGTLRGSKEMTGAFQDLLSRQELIMIARRLHIARMLLRGATYAEVVGKTRASMPTIARVSSWLNNGGSGFRMLHERGLKFDSSKTPPRSNWHAVKRRYPLYFWPQLLIEEIIRDAPKRKQKQMRILLSKLKDKQIKSP